MGAVHHQIDNRNFMTTIAVVDQFGEVLEHKDFLNIIPPRSVKTRDGDNFEQKDRLRPGEIADMQRHEADKQSFQTIISNHNVDLIVVCADSLESKKLKKALSEFVSSQHE